MAPKKRTTRASPATTTTTTTPVTNAELKALIDQGVADTLAARDSDKSVNGDESHNSRTGVRRQAPLACECTYLDFMKCKTLYFKGTEGVVELTQTVGHDVAYAMTWTNLKKMMTDKYCSRGKIKKLEVEMWNLKVMGTDVDAVEFATKLMDMKICTFAERQIENKRKQDDNQQQENKKQNTGRVYTTGPGRRSHIVDLNHCALNATITMMRNLSCYECGNQGDYMSGCLKLKNQNHGNQAGGTRACGMAHALGGGETNEDLNDIKDDINA
nr:hypothetical protein [Tanacetum cinerariifolium]